MGACIDDQVTHCKIVFGEYVEAHDTTTITNDTNTRTHACIALDTPGNIKGTHKVFDIYTGKLLKGIKMTPMPMPDHGTRKRKYQRRRLQSYQYGNIIQFLTLTRKSTIGTITN